MKAGWRVVPLGDLVDISSGGTPSKERDEYWQGDIPWVSPKDMKSDIIKDSEDHISEAAVTSSATRLIKAGALLLVVRSGILARTIPVSLAGCDLTINQDIKALTPSDRLDSQFLAYFLKSREPHILDKVTRGATVHKLDTPVIKSLLIPLPPLDEQKRIVAVLDEAFEGLSRARSNAEANLSDAQELLENGINSLMAYDLDAVETVLGAICSFENGDRGKNYPGRKAFVSSGVPFINAGHLLNGPIDWAEMNYIPLEHFHRLSNGKVKQHDLLFCLRGSLGKFGVVDSDEPGAIASSLVIVRPKKDRLLPSYLASYFQSKMCKDMIADFENGAAQPNLSAKNLAAFKIALPSVLHQEKVVAQVAELEDQVRRLVQLYEDQLSNLDALRQTLLQRAFSGELT